MSPPRSPVAQSADPADQPPAHRRRDAAKTRQLLLDAGRRRFASIGYAATTVRDIADEAGVNVALISRYFDSKEGLFKACLAAAIEDLGHAVDDAQLRDVPAAIAQQIAGQPNEVLPLLLRSSGDERADQIRLEVFERFSQRLASAAGQNPEGPEGERQLLRAQIVLSASIGIAMLRASTRLEPLASAGEQDLVGPLRDLVDALLPNR